MILNISKIQYL